MPRAPCYQVLFFFHDPPPSEIYTLSLHDALPICIWGTWDARLTSTLILWLLHVSYLLLRDFLEEPARRATLSAVFGIFGFVDVPIVYFSIRIWQIGRAHV